MHKYQDTGSLSDHCIFIEPASQALTLSDTLGYTNDIIQFTGQFYVDKAFPKDYVKTEQTVDKARVFRYTSYKIIKSNYSDAINDKDK